MTARWAEEAYERLQQDARAPLEAERQAYVEERDRNNRRIRLTRRYERVA